MSRILIVSVLALSSSFALGQTPGMLTDVEARILELTNAARKKEGLGPLKISATLMATARAHSKNQAKQEMMAHETRRQEGGRSGQGDGLPVSVGQRERRLRQESQRRHDLRGLDEVAGPPGEHPEAGVDRDRHRRRHGRKREAVLHAELRQAPMTSPPLPALGERGRGWGAASCENLTVGSNFRRSRQGRIEIVCSETGDVFARDGPLTPSPSPPKRGEGSKIP